MNVADQPVRFLPGDVVDPADLNTLMLYAKNALDDVTSRRFAHGILRLPFVERYAVPLDEAASAEMRTLRFISPVTCVIERATLLAQLTSAAAVTVTITTTAGATPDGATSPWISTKGASVTDNVTGDTATSATGIITDANDEVTAFNTNRVLLLADVEYKITVASAGTFDLYVFDLTLHTLTDRWTTADVDERPSFDPVLLTDASMRDADAVNANKTAFAAAVADVGAGAVLGAVEAPTPVMFVLYGITSASDADMRKLILPLLATTRAQARVLRVFVFAVMSNTLGTTVTATLDVPGTTVFAPVDVSGVTQKSASLIALNESLLGAAGVTVDAASDAVLTVSNESATTSALKLYALVWISR